MEMVNMSYVIGKTCPMCFKFKSKDRYDFSSTSKHMRYECKECASKRNKAYRIRHKSRIQRADRIGHYVSKYGLSRECAENLVDNRMGVCDICSEYAPLEIDHCHTRGHVRGLLCKSCNSTLGQAKDNIHRLKQCIKYLERDES